MPTFSVCVSVTEIGWLTFKSAIMYADVLLRNIDMKSGIGKYCLAGGWYNVEMIIFPVAVSISTANVSDMKSSINLYDKLCFIAIAVPSV